MAPIMDIPDNEDFKKLAKVADAFGIKYNSESPAHIDNSIYIPSINMDVSRERDGLGKNWYESHYVARDEGGKMLHPIDFVEMLRYVRENEPELFNEITQVRSPWRAEWMDAYFEKRDDGLYILTDNKNSAEKLDEETLIEDRLPGISLDDWIDNPTKQGLPRKNVKNGKLWYGFPRDGRVARFDAGSGRSDLDSSRNPSIRNPNFGVRVGKKRDKAA